MTVLWAPLDVSRWGTSTISWCCPHRDERVSNVFRDAPCPFQGRCGPDTQVSNSMQSYQLGVFAALAVCYTHTEEKEGICAGTLANKQRSAAVTESPRKSCCSRCLKSVCVCINVRCRDKRNERIHIPRGHTTRELTHLHT